MAVFTFGAPLNAFGMISPVYALEALVLGPIFIAGLVMAPKVLLVLFHATDLDFCFARSHRPRGRLGKINAR